MKSTMRFTLTLVLFLILVAGGPKVQHFGLSNSIPSADSKIVSPGQLQLWFTQAPQEGSVTIRLSVLVETWWGRESQSGIRKIPN